MPWKFVARIFVARLVVARTFVARILCTPFSDQFVSDRNVVYYDNLDI